MNYVFLKTVIMYIFIIHIFRLRSEEEIDLQTHA